VSRLGSSRRPAGICVDATSCSLTGAGVSEELKREASHSQGPGFSSCEVARGELRAGYLSQLSLVLQLNKKLETVPITGRGGPLGCEILRIPHCLDNRLIDGGKFVSPMHRPNVTPQKHFLLCFQYSFLLEAGRLR
jgi:hypothetical protein